MKTYLIALGFAVSAVDTPKVSAFGTNGCLRAPFCWFIIRESFGIAVTAVVVDSDFLILVSCHVHGPEA